MMATAIRVLYVDDEPDLLEIGKLFLEESGNFAVTTALSASEALRLLEQEKFDAIISDYQMPGMDGIQFLIEVRTRVGPVPFILFTGKGREEVVIQAINSGADFYLQKGGDPSAQFAELVHKIKQAALRNKAENSLRKSEEKYRHLIEHSNEAILVAQDGMLKRVNHRLIELLGYSEPELLSTQFPVFIHPDDRAMVVERYQKRLKGEEYPSRYSFRLNPKDGNILWVEISAVVIEWDGRPATLNFLTDITERKQADESRRFNEERLQMAQEIGHIGCWEYDIKTNLMWGSGEGCHLFGYPRVAGSFPIENFASCIAEPERVLKAFNDLIHEGKEYDLDFIINPKDGSAQRTLHSIGILEKDGQGNPIKVKGINQDITERKRAEDTLQESEARFRTILEMAPLPLCYVNVNGVITFRNERFVQIFGYTADDVPTLAEWWQQAYPDAHYRQLVTTTWDAAVKRATENGTDIKPVEYTVTCKSGEERIIEISGITLGEDFLATFIDLTERRRAEAAFRQLSADHKVIIDHAPAMVWYKDTKNNFIRVNPAGALAFGLPVEEIEGKNTYDLFPDFAEKYYQDDLDVINSGKPRLGIIEPMTTASGEHLWVQTDKIPLRDEQGTITGILLFAVDITSRKRAEEALALAIKKLALLSSITRHDILNQLTVLIGHLELLERKQPDPSFTTYFNKISRAADRINAMIQFTKEYESIGVHAPTWQDIRTLVDTAAKQAPLGKVMVKNDLPASAEVFADPLIGKVFYNLMDNAGRYGGKITTLRFSALESGDDQVIVCEDDGDGIVATEKEKIFERGFGKNTGLGLALSREILDITGITIRETGEPGNGARFELVVPKGAWRTAGGGK